MDCSTQNAGSLAVNDPHLLHMTSHSFIQIPLHNTDGFHRIHATQIHLGRSGSHLHFPAGVSRTGLFLLVGIVVFQEVDLVCLGSHLQNACLELISTILVDGNDAGLCAQLQQFDCVTHQNATGRLWPLFLGSLGLELAFRLIEAPAQLSLPLVDAGGICAVLELLTQCFQLVRSGIGSATGILDDLLGLPSCLLHSLFPFLLKLCIINLRLLLDLLCFLAQPFRFSPGSFHLLPLLFQLCQHILKVLIALTHQIVGLFQNLLRKTQFPGNGKGIGLTGNANEQLVGRLQGIHIELAGGIDDPLGSHGVELQLRIVGSCNDTAAHIAAKFDQRDGKCRTLSRVSTGTQLIKQNQCPVVTFRNHIHNGAHMAGEGRQALGNGLFVTDIRQNGIEGRQTTAIAGRHMQTALRHQCQQAHRLQGNGLTAGVGAGNDHGVEIRAQPHGNGHDLLLIDQRMPCIAQLYPALVVHHRLPGTHPVSQLRLGKDHIKPYQHGKVQVDIIPMRGSFTGQFRKDPFNFLLFLDLQLAQGIVGIDRRHGFHKIGRTGGGYIVHKTGHIIFALTLHRHHIAALANGDDRIPEELGIGRRRNDLLQAIADLARLDLHVAANIRKLGTSIVRNFFLGQNSPKDPVFQVLFGTQSLKKRIDNGFLFIFGDVTLDSSGAAKHCGDPQQLLGLQTAAQICPFQGCGHIVNISKIGVTLSGAQIRCGGSFRQHGPDILQVGTGPQTAAGILALTGSGALRKEIQNLIQFQF